jgi:FlaA1/EpsC-like NDP-sugar epimerase
MGVETESRTREGVSWSPRLRGGSSRPYDGPLGGGGGRRAARRGAEARGPAACMRRDALFRRSLLVADIAAIVTALVLTTALSSRRLPLQLTWESVVGVALLLVGAKLLGLYDRDETLLRKTTLGEAPRLFQLATLCTLIGWLGGQLALARTLDRREALFLWLALGCLLILARVAARSFALRASAAERCLLIGDERSAAMISSKLIGARRGIKAEVVATLDHDQAALWSTDSFSALRLAEIGDLARTLDVHRAIVAPGWGAEMKAGETLNLVRTLKAVGVRVSVLPRLPEVVGSSVEFDDLHGIPLMGLRRF